MEMHLHLDFAASPAGDTLKRAARGVVRGPTRRKGNVRRHDGYASQHFRENPLFLQAPDYEE